MTSDTPRTVEEIEADLIAAILHRAELFAMVATVMTRLKESSDPYAAGIAPALVNIMDDASDVERLLDDVRDLGVFAKKGQGD